MSTIYAIRCDNLVINFQINHAISNFFFSVFTLSIAQYDRHILRIKRKVMMALDRLDDENKVKLPIIYLKSKLKRNKIQAGTINTQLKMRIRCI